MQPAPATQRPDYRGSGKLQDRVAIITGDDSGIGHAVAVAFAKEGADVAIVYLNEHEDAHSVKQEMEQQGRWERNLLPASDPANGRDIREAQYEVSVANGQKPT